MEFKEVLSAWWRKEMVPDPFIHSLMDKTSCASYEVGISTRQLKDEMAQPLASQSLECIGRGLRKNIKNNGPIVF